MSTHRVRKSRRATGLDIDGEVTSSFGKRRIGRDDRELAKCDALRHGKSPAFVTRRVHGELRMRIEARKFFIGDTGGQQADLATQAARHDVLVQELIGMPAQSTDAYEIRHCISTDLLDHLLPRAQSDDVVLARLHCADEKCIGTRPRGLGGVVLTGCETTRQSGHFTGWRSCALLSAVELVVTPAGFRNRWDGRRALRDEVQVSIEEPIDRSRMPGFHDGREVIEQEDQSCPASRGVTRGHHQRVVDPCSAEEREHGADFDLHSSALARPGKAGRRSSG